MIGATEESGSSPNAATPVSANVRRRHRNLRVSTTISPAEHFSTSSLTTTTGLQNQSLDDIVALSDDVSIKSTSTLSGNEESSHHGFALPSSTRTIASTTVPSLLPHSELTSISLIPTRGSNSNPVPFNMGTPRNASFRTVNGIAIPSFSSSSPSSGSPSLGRNSFNSFSTATQNVTTSTSAAKLSHQFSPITSRTSSFSSPSRTSVSEFVAPVLRASSFTAVRSHSAIKFPSSSQAALSTGGKSHAASSTLAAANWLAVNAPQIPSTSILVSSVAVRNEPPESTGTSTGTCISRPETISSITSSSSSPRLLDSVSEFSASPLPSENPSSGFSTSNQQLALVRFPKPPTQSRNQLIPLNQPYRPIQYNSTHTSPISPSASLKQADSSTGPTSWQRPISRLRAYGSS
jgi:hypothetical protein